MNINDHFTDLGDGTFETSFEIIEDLKDKPAALVLATLLWRDYRDQPTFAADGWAGCEWTRRRLLGARRVLVERGYLRKIGPDVYGWPKG